MATASRGSVPYVLLMRSTDDIPADVATPEDDSLPAVEDERYGTFDVKDGTTVVFDRRQDNAWVRSDTAVRLRR